MPADTYTPDALSRLDYDKPKKTYVVNWWKSGQFEITAEDACEAYLKAIAFKKQGIRLEGDLEMSEPVEKGTTP